MKTPVVILGVPRSGTSMVAGIFVRHGLWVGTCREPDQFNEKGHFETLCVKNLMKRWWHGNGCTNNGVLAEPKEGFRAEVERLLKEDGFNPEQDRWLFKCAPVYWNLFQEWSPDWITVRRDPLSIIHSNERTGFIPTIREVLDDHLAVLDEIEEKGAPYVDADAVVAGNYDSLEWALAHAGIKMDRGVVNDFVSESLWHCGA